MFVARETSQEGVKGVRYKIGSLALDYQLQEGLRCRKLLVLGARKQIASAYQKSKEKLYKVRLSLRGLCLLKRFHDFKSKVEYLNFVNTLTLYSVELFKLCCSLFLLGSEEHADECLRRGPDQLIEGSSATGTECLISQRFADENLVIEPEKI